MKCYFEKYKDIFGKAGEGVHSYRFMGTAVVDVILTFLLAIFISSTSEIPLILSIILCFILGIIAHYIFCVETNTIKYLTK